MTISFWGSFVTGGAQEAGCQTDLQMPEKLFVAGDLSSEVE